MAYVSILAPENYCFCVKNSVFCLFTARKKVALCINYTNVDCGRHFWTVSLGTFGTLFCCTYKRDGNSMMGSSNPALATALRCSEISQVSLNCLLIRYFMVMNGSHGSLKRLFEICNKKTAVKIYTKWFRKRKFANKSKRQPAWKHTLHCMLL